MMLPPGTTAAGVSQQRDGGAFRGGDGMGGAGALAASGWGGSSVASGCAVSAFAARAAGRSVNEGCAHRDSATARA